MPRDLPSLRRTPDDPWLSTRMHHSAQIGQRQLALTDGFAAATGQALHRLRELIMPTPQSRPMLPDPNMARSVFNEACEEFIHPLVGDTWWTQHGLNFVDGILPGIINSLQRVLTQAAADPTVSVEQERAAALSMLYLAGGETDALTAAAPPPSGSVSWSATWQKAWSTWTVAAQLDDDAAVARGHRRVAEALTDRLSKTKDTALRAELQKLIDKRLSAASSVNPTAARVSAALDKFTSAANALGVITGTQPFPGLPTKPVSTAPAAKKNYYTISQRRARSATVSSFNQDALDRAKQDAASSDTPLVKTWLATADARTRDDHDEADGQQVSVDEPFVVGGEELDYPGDPNGSDEQTINCRCTFITEEADATSSDDGGDTLLALTAAAQEALMTLPTGFEGVLAPLDTVSGDGREIATPPQLRLRLAPIPFFWQRESDDEHGGSVQIGRIDRAWIDGGNLMGEGTFDMDNVDAQEYARQLGNGFASRVSVDLDDVTVDFRVDEGEGEVDDEDDMFFMPEGTVVYVDWRLAGATAVGVSAFDEAIITPVFQTAASPVASGMSLHRLAAGYEPQPYVQDADETVQCDNCQLFNSPDAIYCDQCGQKLANPGGEAYTADPDETIQCPQCQKMNSPDARYCDQCGYQLEGSTDVATSAHTVVFAVEGEVAVGDQVELDDPDNPGTTVTGTVTAIDNVGVTADTTVTVSLPALDGSADARLVTVPLADVTPVAAEPAASLVASLVAPLAPPREWFTDPKYGLGGEDKRLQPLLGQPGAYAAPLSIDDDGRISGHLAAWGTCHTGLPGCTTPPNSRSSYLGFMLGETVVADGGRIPTGVLTFNTGHADIAMDAQAARRHYDDTGAAFASVTVGEDIYGIWVAGALLPDVKPETLPRLRASKLSGDWRRGELLAALAVNTPGFPVMRARANTPSERPLALVASGVPHFVCSPKRRRQGGVINQKLVDRLTTEIEKNIQRRAHAAELSAKVNKIKAQRVAARIGKES